jgi:hypothetical protein
MHRRQHALEPRIQELARLLRVAVGQRLYRVFKTDEQDRHLLVFPFQSTQHQKWCDAGHDTGGG